MQPAVLTAMDSVNNYLHLIDRKGIHDFCCANIIRMEASDNYTIVYAHGQRPFIVSKVLKCYEAVLKPFGFVRTHRSHLVNRHFVQSINKCLIVMQDASIVKITKRKRRSCLLELKQ